MDPRLLEPTVQFTTGDESLASTLMYEKRGKGATWRGERQQEAPSAMISAVMEGVWRGCSLVDVGSHDHAKRGAPMRVRWGMLLLGILSACTVVPTGPSVLVLPAVGKSMDMFQVEEGECRSYARQQLGGAPEQAASTRRLQVQYDRAYVQCMYAKGNMVPGVVVAPGPSVAPSPPGTSSPSTPQR
jgi:hypothetical protein